MLNLHTHLLWASSRQHECGIKHNKLSASVLPSVTLEWVTTSVCTSVYLCRRLYIYIYIYIYYTSGYACMSLWIKSVLFFQTHLNTRVCAFMNKKWFSGLTVSRWPQAGVLTRHLFSYKWGVHCCFCVCSSAALSFIRKYFSQHISIKSTQTWYMYIFLYDTSRLSLKEEESVWLPSIAIYIK